MPTPRFKNLTLKKEEMVKDIPVMPDTDIKVSRLVEKLGEKKESVPFNLKLIPREKIEFHSQNNYPQVEIEKLADNILHFGLIHNLEGYYDEERDIYVLESGERRTRALDFLLNKFSQCVEEDMASQEYKYFLDNVQGFQKGYPFNVKRQRFTDTEYSRLDMIDSELRLLDANEEVRPDAPQLRVANISRRAKLLEERNQLLDSHKKKINVNKTIAEKEGISERQVQKYRNVATLIPELQNEFKKRNISLSAGSNYSKFTEEEQHMIWKLLQDGNEVTAKDIQKMKEEEENIQRELQKKTFEIEKIRQEKDSLAESVAQRIKQLENSIEAERKKVRKELQEAQEDHHPVQSIQKLERKLQEMEQSRAQIIQESNHQVEQKEEELKQLKNKIQELENSTGTSLQVVRSETALEAAINQCKRSEEELREAYNVFSELAPEKICYYKKAVQKFLQL